MEESSTAYPIAGEVGYGDNAIGYYAQEAKIIEN